MNFRMEAELWTNKGWKQVKVFVKTDSEGKITKMRPSMKTDEWKEITEEDKQ